MAIAQASSVRWCFTLEISRMLKYIFQDNTDVFTLGLSVPVASPILMLIYQTALVVGTSNHTITSVFASFSLSLFTVIQDRTLAMQFFQWCWFKCYAWLCFLHSIGYKVVSSANPWRLMAYMLITLLSGKRYTRKRRGLRTDPLGHSRRQWHIWGYTVIDFYCLSSAIEIGLHPWKCCFCQSSLSLQSL